MRRDIPLLIDQRERMEKRSGLDEAVELVEKRCDAAAGELKNRFHEDHVSYARAFEHHQTLRTVLNDLQQLSARQKGM